MKGGGGEGTTSFKVVLTQVLEVTGGGGGCAQKMSTLTKVGVKSFTLS